MGTMLQRHGLKLGEIPELLAITNPDLLTNIHRQYIEAGTEIVYANTFGANRRKMQKTPYTVADVVSAAIAAAKKACIGTSARVALDIGPLGELLEPMGTLPFETAVDMFAEIVDAGVNAGADLICIETMTDLYEAKAALLAAKEHSTLPVWVTMSFDATGRTFTGCTIPSMARTLEGLGADAIGLNCSQGPKQLLPLFQELCRVTTLPVIAKPNAGLPDPVDGHYDLPPEDFARTMVDVVGAGVSIVGGCCGTNPDYIRALHGAVHTMTPGARDIHHGSFLCTPTMPLEISGVRVIGERINPTGKKRFQQALLAGDLDYIVDVAIAQVDAGAQILDVNVGYPGVDEVAMLPRVVKKLQEAVDVPLQLDSTNAAALEAALRVYNGKAAVNSVNGEEKVLQTLLPVVKKYGALLLYAVRQLGEETMENRRSLCYFSRSVHRCSGRCVPHLSFPALRQPCGRSDLQREDQGNRMGAGMFFVQCARTVWSVPDGAVHKEGLRCLCIGICWATGSGNSIRYSRCRLL